MKVRGFSLCHLLTRLLRVVDDDPFNAGGERYCVAIVRKKYTAVFVLFVFERREIGPVVKRNARERKIACAAERSLLCIGAVRCDESCCHGARASEESETGAAQKGLRPENSDRVCVALCGLRDVVGGSARV